MEMRFCTEVCVLVRPYDFGMGRRAVIFTDKAWRDLARIGELHNCAFCKRHTLDMFWGFMPRLSTRWTNSKRVQEHADDTDSVNSKEARRLWATNL